MNIAVKPKQIAEHQKVAATLPDKVIVGAIEYADKIAADADHIVKHDEVLNILNSRIGWTTRSKPTL